MAAERECVWAAEAGGGTAGDVAYSEVSDVADGQDECGGV